MDFERPVLIVEDDAALAGLLCARLKKHGYRCFVPASFHEIDTLCRQLSPLIILMDVILPEENGFVWTERIRRFSTVPILFISSKAEDSAKIVALSQGGDDFVVKPFLLDVLEAKMEALLRRTYEMPQQEKMMLSGGYIYDRAAGSLSDGIETIALSQLERRVLDILCRKKGDIVTREELKMELWQTDEFISDGSLSTVISRLRKKLTHAEECPIETVIGQGYRIC